ncbi:SMI1/KNR4 family protein [Streptacidiphilus sp. N1-10]|uniref:SMI1/KNR4 family protein n=1 Tax=Streptacidiphilus jeojiensis TaxID=3229225 RepID=A0ABV6XJR7_9ACTN
MPSAPASHRTLHRIAFAQEIAKLEAELGFRLHPELKGLLRLHNGTDRSAVPGSFLPLSHRLIGTGEITDMHRILVDMGWHGPDSPWDQDYLNGHPHQWVPFAVPLDGGVAFVDHRPGPTYGHVFELGVGSGDIDATLWATSLAELFDALADAVEHTVTFLHYRPRLEGSSADGALLTWDVVTG